MWNRNNLSLGLDNLSHFLFSGQTELVSVLQASVNFVVSAALVRESRFLLCKMGSGQWHVD